jgi:DNA adenine methylase
MSCQVTAPLGEARPFVKWVGGKGKLCRALSELLPPQVEFMRHVEPFLGGGALFFARNPATALLSDVNSDLIATYEAVRDEPCALISQLCSLAILHGQDHYYAVRERYNERSSKSRVERAAQFIYLNKTCFNGLFRVNRKGEFNVPVGRYTNPNIADAGALLAASMRLQGIELRCASFERLLDSAGPGDFVYMDPPYAPVSATSNFTTYAKGGFSLADQERLAAVFHELDRRGARLMLSNSDAPLIRELYRGYQTDVVLAPRAVSCDGSGRGKVSELVIRNYGGA